MAIIFNDSHECQEFLAKTCATCAFLSLQDRLICKVVPTFTSSLSIAFAGITIDTAIPLDWPAACPAELPGEIQHVNFRCRWAPLLGRGFSLVDGSWGSNGPGR